MICPQTRPWTLIPEECPPPVFLNLDTTFVRTIGRRYTLVNRKASWVRGATSVFDAHGGVLPP